MVGVIVAIIAIMTLLGVVITREYRSLQLRSAAETGNLYIEGFIAPHAASLLASDEFRRQFNDLVAQVTQRTVTSRGVRVLNVWAPDGHLVFSTNGAFNDADHDPSSIEPALRGELVASIDEEEKIIGDAEGEEPPYMEVYSPIYDPASNRLVAVGEIYSDASGLLSSRNAIELSTWLKIALATAGLLGMLLLVMAQRAELLDRLAAERASALANDKLRRAADRARIASARSHEDLLNRIGAELHDGPIQLLTLMALDREGQGAAGGAEADGRTGHGRSEIAQRAIDELRAISAGLVLPELDSLTLGETLTLAVSRQEQATGAKVSLELGETPAEAEMQMKVCFYRVVHEGLTNAIRHGGGQGLGVSAGIQGDRFVVTIRNAGDRSGEHHAAPRSLSGLGLVGLRHRLEVFGGGLRLDHADDGGRVLTAWIPLSRPEWIF